LPAWFSEGDPSDGGVADFQIGCAMTALSICALDAARALDARRRTMIDDSVETFHRPGCRRPTAGAAWE
jgi:hypothetical protein